jgi:methylmalonyl-CoA mutase
MPTFNEFSAPSREAWNALLEKDLKGQAWTNLQWQVADGLLLNPFYLTEDQETSAALAGSGPGWTIGETLKVADLKIAYAQIMEALEGGVEALNLQLNRDLLPDEWAALLKGVELAYISLNVSAVDAELSFESFQAGFWPLAEHTGQATQLQGSWSNPQASLEQQVQALKWAPVHLPKFRWFSCATKLNADPGQAPDSLTELLQQANVFLEAMENAGLSLAQAQTAVQFKIKIGRSYFLEIAKIRALKILWANLQKAWNLSIQPAYIQAELDPQSQDDNPNNNMIRTATQAMSAVIGGADVLFVLPADEQKDPVGTAFSRRMARNAQHLLKLESHLDKVEDPAAGSYYIQQLTDQLCVLVWGQLQQENMI